MESTDFCLTCSCQSWKSRERVCRIIHLKFKWLFRGYSCRLYKEAPKASTNSKVMLVAATRTAANPPSLSASAQKNDKLPFGTEFL